MKVLISGTAAVPGWPAPGCGCASCGRLTPGHRRPTEVTLTDDSVRLPLTGPLPPCHQVSSRPTGVTLADDSVRLPLTGPLPSGHRVSTGPDGLTLTTPGGERVLYAAPAASHDTSSPAPSPDSRDAPPSADRYGERGAERVPARAENGPAVCDLVLIDVLDRPERLGDLRRRGVIGERTHVVAVDIDHRVPTEAELARRAALWGVRAVPDGTVLDTGEPVPGRPPRPRRTLLLGGARSGKSAEAELRLAGEPEVLYVATGPSGGGDAEWTRRVQAHRDRRPAHWGTAETTDLAGLLRTAEVPMLIDGLGTWVAAVFDECDAWSGGDGRDAVTARCDELVAAWRQARAQVVAVSDEVGLGVVPATSSGRMFRDVLGRLNQRLALESEDVALVAAGRLLPLPI
ncbi:adenosylcobinamide kinase /adenosylcobinamide-phosphate guanylyltransferase [Streptosporangium canum]|uniref:Adenosylcobinamide kinase n=1 Tax=Streptosporangium canum TaxID=324952 RepID=A0A1I3PM55_9ACTN|nr:bifunctional adenosylcobinamide kinase/adenosylcobinamide-phosphate guanylyltransferase [Streptosporangium canum]SFJ22592.1 adenosylcobinamide kinase /adenosylcobinamide-phosphate guanylyltransferase [Streptosporangium canum]